MPRYNPITKEELQGSINNSIYIQDVLDKLHISQGTFRYLLKKYNIPPPSGYLKRKPIEDKTKEKMSKNRKGKNNPFYGKKHTSETKEKMSKNHADFTGDKNPFKKSLKDKNNYKKLQERTVKYWSNKNVEQRHSINKKNIYEEISKGYWTRLLNNARLTNKTVNITPEYIWNIYLKQNKKCALSGLDVNFKSCYEITASVDRIDSSIGYIEGNIQILHKHVNFMKNNLKQEQFLFYIKNIAYNLNL